ncbi:MAG: hypothetical protein ACRDJE_20295 [Dehalococcoidia bacterium]
MSGARDPGRRRLLAWAAGGGAAIATFAVAQPWSARVAQASGRPSIVGTWRGAVAEETPEGPRETVTLVTFFADGTLIESNAPGFSTAHGVWSQLGPDSYAVTQEFIASVSEAGEEMSVIGTVRGRAEVDATGNQFTAQFRIDLHTPDGMLLESGEGTVRAVRVQLQSP